jgi:hypothetical protein
MSLMKTAAHMMSTIAGHLDIEELDESRSTKEKG